MPHVLQWAGASADGKLLADDVLKLVEGRGDDLAQIAGSNDFALFLSEIRNPATVMMYATPPEIALTNTVAWINTILDVCHRYGWGDERVVVEGSVRGLNALNPFGPGEFNDITMNMIDKGARELKIRREFVLVDEEKRTVALDIEALKSALIQHPDPSTRECPILHAKYPDGTNMRLFPKFYDAVIRLYDESGAMYDRGLRVLQKRHGRR